MTPLDLLAGFWSFLVGLLVPFTLEPQVASVFVMVVATLFNLTSLGLNKLLIDVKQQQEYMQLTAEYRALQKEARLSGDKKLQAKLRKREAAMRRLAGKVVKHQLLMTVISLALFGFFFGLVGNAFQVDAPPDQPRPAALLPIGLSPTARYIELPMFYWYLISSLAISRPLYRVLRVPVGLSLPGTEAKEPVKAER